MLAKSLSAMLCARGGNPGAACADPLLGNSRSSSPYIKPQEAQPSSTTSAGSLDTAVMQLPPAAVPMHARPSPLGAAPVQRNLHLLQQQCGHDSQCSHSSAHGDSCLPAGTTPLSLFKARTRLGVPCCYGSPCSNELTEAVSAEPAGPAFTIEEPTCLGAAAVAPAQQQLQREGSPAADRAAACQGTIEVEAPAVCTAHKNQQQQQQPAARRPSSVINSPKAWLYELVTCPFLFKACPQCSATNSGREVLITYFDTDRPSQGYCTYCPQRHSRPHLLQIRRSTYHEVVKAADVSRLTDVSGIQHYVINGAKVLFLRPRPQPRPPKGVVAPARCAVDGRQLMDAHSSYCSLRCKLEVEDVVFAAHFPSAAEEMQAAAAAAAAGGADAGAAAGAGALAGTYHKQGGHEGRRVVVPTHKRPSSSTPQPAPQQQQLQQHNSHDDSSEDAADAADHAGWGARHKRHRHMPSKFANAVVGGHYQAAVAGGHHRAGHQLSSIKVRDDTASDQAAAAFATTSPGGTPMAGDAGVAGLQLLHKGAAAEAGSRRGSSCGSDDDSGRSTSCSQRAHKRKRAPPCRSALQ